MKTWSQMSYREKTVCIVNMREDLNLGRKMQKMMDMLELAGSVDCQAESSNPVWPKIKGATRAQWVSPRMIYPDLYTTGQVYTRPGYDDPDSEDFMAWFWFGDEPGSVEVDCKFADFRLLESLGGKESE